MRTRERISTRTEERGRVVQSGPTPPCQGFEIQGVTGTLIDKGILTINGCGFGNDGPTLSIYDEFDLHGGASEGDEIDLLATFGTWTQNISTFQSNRPTYMSGGHSGDYGFLGVEPGGGGSWGKYNGVEKHFTATNEMFISYAAKVPDGYTFPGASTEETFPSESVWKMSWGMDGPGATTNDDIILFTWSPSPNIGGNDMSGSYVNTPLGWAWDIWNRYLFHVEFGPGSGTGTIHLAANVQEGAAGWSEPLNYNSTLSGGTSPYQWRNWGLCGWAGNATGNWANCRVIYDTVYLAVGDHANARVEIGDNATYTSSTRLSFVTVESPTDWTDTQITGTLRQGSFPDTFPGTQDLWLWVIKPDETKVSYKIN